ncbi:MAG: DUF3667 domain-containing protein [Sphingomicrobium sp.]
MVGEINSNDEAVGDGHSHETHCLNCRAPVTGAYCARCGQKAHVHRTIGAFFHDLLHGVLHVDGKMWRTLPLLVWRPGDLTRRYIDGQRASFVSPMAMFLFSVFMMFAVLGATVDTNNIGSPQISGDLDKAMAETKTRIAGLEQRRAVPLGPGTTKAMIDQRIAKEQGDLRDLETMKSISLNRPTPVTLSSRLEWLQKPIEHALQNPDLLVYKIRTSAYKWSWLVIPISAPFLWLLFPFSRRFRMYDHVVFVTYSMAFMTIVAVVSALVYFAGAESFASMAFFIPPVHLYRQLKGAYGLNRFGALWRAVALTVFAVIALGLFAVLMITVGVL